MAGMKLIGPEPRAKALKSAANRLRWEVDYALGDGSTDGEQHRPHEVGGIAADLAETLAILRTTLETIDRHTEVVDAARVLGGPFREELARLLEFYRTYHETPR